MKIIIAGSRNITDKYRINQAIFNGIKKLISIDKINEVEIISGCARGVDEEGEHWARSLGLKVLHFPADWDKFGKRAGFLRNKEMIDVADGLIAIWDGESKGTQHTINLAKDKGIPIHVELII